jgi:tetratricopeptide (TPR) repeat protein
VELCLDGLADVAASQGRFDDARRLYEQVLGTRRRTLGPAHPQVAWTLASLADVTWKAGEPVVAARLADEAVAIFDKSGAGDEPDRYAQALELKGLLEASTGRVREGRVNLEKALSERSRIFGRTHPLVASTQASIAEVEPLTTDLAECVRTPLGRSSVVVLAASAGLGVQDRSQRGQEGLTGLGVQVAIDPHHAEERDRRVKPPLFP